MEGVKGAAGEEPRKAEDMQKACVVIDVGSLTTKCGLAGEAEPRSEFPSYLGRCQPMVNMDIKAVYVGHEARQKRGVLRLRRPIVRGVVTNWEDVEAIWRHVFVDNLRVAPEEHPVLLAEPPLNPKANRERMTEIMFNTFGVPQLFLAVQAFLALIATERTTGLVVDSGHSVSYAVPIARGFYLPHAVVRLELGGQDVSEQLQPKLEGERLAEFKERSCYVALDFDAETAKADHEEGAELGRERFLCPEVLFQPKLLAGRADVRGLHEAALEAINTCDVDVRTDLWSNIVIAGGGTQMAGFAERLEKELQARAPLVGAMEFVGCPTHPLRVKVLAPTKREHLAWRGGSVLGSTAPASLWISKAEFLAQGPSIVHERCF